MSRRALFLWLALASLMSPSMVSATVRRIAVVAGRNEGAPGRVDLRYAVRDAARVASLLVELGGFEPSHVLLAPDANRHALLRAIEEAATKVREADALGIDATLLVVYFSGHADGEGLELGDERMPFDELRASVEAVPSSLRIVVVDTCQSGQMLRAKGGVPGPDFDITLLDTLDSTGTAIVTSASASERAQESDLLEGSFFTHHLVSALRGAADSNGDRRVTLTEAYRYAYGRTVVETARTMGGPQHPAYEYRVEGRGDVVLTDLSTHDAALVFGPALSGDFHVVDREADAVVAEVTKEAGTTRRLALRSGLYGVVQARNGGYAQADVVLTPDQEVRLEPGAFQADVGSLGLPKGGGRPREVALWAGYDVQSAPLGSTGLWQGASAGASLSWGGFSLRPCISAAAGELRLGDVNGQGWGVGVGVLAGWRWAWRPLALLAGLDAALRYEVERVRGDRQRGGLAGMGGAAVALEAPIAWGLGIGLTGSGGGYLARVNGSTARYPWWRAGVVIRFSLGR